MKSPVTTRKGAPAKLHHQAMIYAVAAAVTQLIVAVSYAITARSMGPTEFGLIVSYIAVATFAAGAVDFGLNNYWTTRIASDSVSRTELSAEVRAKLLSGLILAAAVCGVSELLGEFGSLTLFAVVAALAMLCNQTALVPLRAAQKPQLVLMAMASDKLICLAVVTLFVSIASGQAAYGLILGVTLGQLVGAAVAVLLTAKERRVVIIGFGIRLPWRRSSHFGFFSLASTVQQLDTPILSAWAGASAAGIYGGVNRWTSPIMLLGNSIAQAALPASASARSLSGGLRTVRKSYWLVALAGVAGAIVVIFSDGIVLLILGPAYGGSVPVLRILVLAALVSCVLQPVIAVLQGSGRAGPVATMMMLAVLAQFGLIVALSPAMGAQGAALANLVAQSILLVLVSAYVWLQLSRTSLADGRQP